jgi:Tol biopolymer transport system component
MPLDVGTRLGAYEVLSAIGAGGMGEVYRARDTRLKRDVAIKVLPDGFATDPDRLARFHREAELLASLNHPNIASIYGLEQVDSITAIVLELIDGDTLADLIARGPLLMTAALPIARQVAEALEAAHEKGVIHRDLKPANIKVTPDGTVKVLDFGLATVVQRSTPQNINATHSPTLTLATQAGVILGTAAYMSPEQASGAIADKRSDVWAFGVVLWEMLIGTRLFDGETVSHTLAFVLTKEPDWTALPANTPTSIRRLLRRCLEKDRKKRIGDITSARIEIDDATGAASSDAIAPVATTPTPAVWRRVVPWALAAIGALAAGLMLALWAPWKTAPLPISRMLVDIGADASLTTSGTPASNIALSADGTLLAYIAQKTAGSVSQMFVRRLDQLQAVPLPSTENAVNPFFSPDGQWIAFFADGKLKKIPTTGGAAIALCDASNGRGGAWSEDGTIVFAGTATPGSGLLRVSSAGGTPTELTKPTGGQTLHRWPQSLRQGRTILFSAAASAGNFDDGDIVALTVPEGTQKIVHRGGYFGRYISSGHLLYIHGGTLFAAPFDVDRLDVTGQSFPVFEGVASSTGTGAVQLAVSSTGTLVYHVGQFNSNESPMAWLDRSGKTTPLRSTPSNWSNPQFSPDGRLLAIDINDPAGLNLDIHTYDWSRDTLTRLTFDPGLDVKPVWTPDGRRIAFSSNRGDKTNLNLYWQRADGSGDAQRLTQSKNNQYAASWHPNGKLLAFYEQTPENGTDLMILPIEGDDATGWKPGKPTVFLSTTFGEQEPMFSPDGRWLAYSSTSSGRPEVYVRPFPGPGGLQQVSTTGAAIAMWSRTKPELVFLSANPLQLMAATYFVSGGSFRADKPHVWSPGRPAGRPRLRALNLHPDGERMVIAPPQDTGTTTKQNTLVFILNFSEELKGITAKK